MDDRGKELILIAAYYRAELDPSGERYIKEPTERELACFEFKEWRRITIENEMFLCRTQKISAAFRNDRFVFGGELVFRKVDKDL